MDLSPTTQGIDQQPLHEFQTALLSVPRSVRFAAAITAFGGLSVGVFAWYLLATHAHLHPAASNLSLPLLVVFFVGGILAFWLLYSRWLSRAAGAGAPWSETLWLDAWSYVPFWLLWLYLFQLPPSLTSAAALAGGMLLLSAAIKMAVLARYFAMFRYVSLAFVATRVPINIIAPLAAITINQRQGHHWSAAHGLLDVWGRWDAQHYLTIATSGYQGKEIAFFPLYPWLVHFFGGLIGDHLTAALVISNLAFFVALCYLYALVRLEFGDETIAFHAIFYVAIFPTAIFFSAVYTESLFLMLTVASVYYARHGNYITSGIFGALASLTRVEGVLTLIPLAYEAWHGWRERRGTTLWRGIIGCALVPMGIVVYMGYLFALVGDPLFFLKVQDNWNRHLSLPWVSVVNTIKEITSHPLASSGSVNHIIELVFTIAFLALVVIAFRKLRPSYSWYFLASLLMPMSTASLMSMPRFVLVMFPAFMLLAIWGRSAAVNAAIVALSLPLLGLFTVLFADWYWLA